MLGYIMINNLQQAKELREKWKRANSVWAIYADVAIKECEREAKELKAKIEAEGCGMKLREGFADEGLCHGEERCIWCEYNEFSLEKNKAYSYVESIWEERKEALNILNEVLK